MQLLPVVAGAIVPHAPLLLPELGSPEVAEAAATIQAAVRSIDLRDAETVVVVSPHARRTGVYVTGRASLAELGAPVDLQIRVDEEIARRLATEALLEVVEADADHGVMVPLALLGWNGVTLPVGFEEVEFEDVGNEWAGMDAGERLARAIDAIAADRRIAVIASANGAAGLSPRAPLTEIPETKEVEKALVSVVETNLAELSKYAIVLARRGRSCGLLPYRVFGYLFADRRARVLAHEAPVGVGYLVAEIE